MTETWLCPRGNRGVNEKATQLRDRLALQPIEVAEALGLSERTIRQILPELPHVRIGSAVVIPIDPLRDWLRERAHQEQGAIDRAVEEVLDGLSS